MRLATTEPRVSVRSLASSLALWQGVPLEYIVTLGNWVSSFHPSKSLSARTSDPRRLHKCGFGPRRELVPLAKYS